MNYNLYKDIVMIRYREFRFYWEQGSFFIDLLNNIFSTLTILIVYFQVHITIRHIHWRYSVAGNHKDRYDLYELDLKHELDQLLSKYSNLVDEKSSAISNILRIFYPLFLRKELDIEYKYKNRDQLKLFTNISD